MSIFDFFGIGKKKEVAPTSAGASVLLENAKKPVASKPVASTGAWAVAEVTPQPKIDFFTPKTKVASVPQVGTIWWWSVQTEIPKIDFLAGKSNEPATTEYKWALWSAIQQTTKALTQAWYKTAEHFLRKASPTEDMVDLVPDKYKDVVRKHFEEKTPDVWYNKLQKKDTELMQNPEFASKFDKWIVTAIKEKDRNTLSNPEFWWEVIGQWLWGAVPSIAIALATKNPQLATIAFFPQMEQEAYEDIDTDEETKGLPEWVKEWYAMTVGVLNTAIEGIGLNFLTKPFLRAMKKEIIGEVLKSPLKAWIKSVAQSMWSEGLEEVMQQLTSDIFAKMFGSKRNLPSLEELGNIFASASFGVGPISVAGWVTEFDTQGKINKEIMAKPVEKWERFQEQQDMKKIWSNKTEEWKFSIYDVDKNHPWRWDMFTVHEDKNWRIVRNAYVPENMQNQWIATNFYKQMNEKSIENTWNPLRSTQPRKLINWEVVHKLSNDWIRLWDWLVEKWLAKKLWEKDYIMVEQTQEQPNKQSEKIAYDLEQKYPVKIDMYPKAKDIVELSKIVVDKNQRNSWIGTKVMQEIIDRADSKWITIALTPDTSLWSSKWRLVDFYKRLWFVANKWKNFQTMESYIREPQQEKLSKPKQEKTSPKKETFTNIEIKAKEKIKYKSISGKSIQDNFYGKLNDTDAEIPMKDGKPEYIYNNSEVNIDNTREGFVGAMKYLWKRLSWKNRILKTPFTFNTDKKTPWDLDIAIDPYGFQEVLPILLIEAKTNAGKPINKIQNGIWELNIFDTFGSKWVKIDNTQENKSKINQLIKNGTIKVWFHYFTDGIWIDVEIFSEAGGMSFDIIGEWKDNDMIPLDIDGIQINTMTPESYKNYVENLLAEDFSKELDDSKTEKFKVAKRINDYIETLEVIASMDSKKGRAWIKQTLTDFIARIFKLWSRNKSFLIDSIKKSNVVKNSWDTEWVDVIERSRSAHKDISGKGKEQLPSVNKFINNTSILKKEIKTELKKTSVNKDKLIKLKKRIQTEFGKYDYRGEKNFHLFNEYYLLNEIYAKRIDWILWLDISNNQQFEPTMERLEENWEEMNALEAKWEFNAGRTVRPIIYDWFEEFPLWEVITKESEIKQWEFMVYDTPKEVKYQEKVKQQPATAEDIAKAQKLLPEATYKTVQQIVNPKTGIPAYGSYLDGMITFAKTLTKTTAYHEVFHAYFDMFTDQKAQREMLEIVKREQKIDNDLDAEERLAEKFAEHVINIEKWKDTKGNYKLLDFLDELRAKVKEIFGQWNKIKQLYSDIMEWKRPVKQDMTRQLQKKFKEKSEVDKLLEEMDPIRDKDYTKKWEEYLEIVEPTLKEIEEITAETTNFKTMTDKELEKYYMSGKYDKLSDFEKQEFDNIMNKRVFQDPMQFADPDRQKFIDRIAKLEYKEQRIGMVGKNKISKEKAHQQSLVVDSEREWIIEDIKEHYQFEDTNDAYDMYAQLRDVPVDQIKYEPRKWSYVSKAEKERRVAERVDKTRRETPEEKERRLRSIMWWVVSNARLRGMETTEVKAMLTLLNVNKWELPPPLVQENNLSKDFYDRNKLSEKERKEVLKSKASKDVKEWALNRRSKYIKPIGTQLENISKSVYGRIKKYDYDVLIKGQQDMKDAIPFLEWMIKLKKQNIDDYFSLWLALSNRDVMKAKEVMAKYGIEFPKALLDRIYKEWEEAGFDIGHLEDYFPRVVKDSKWLIGALRRSPERSYIEDAIRRIEEMREEKLTIEEQGEIINALLLGKAVDGVMIWSPNMKERSIELVKKDLLQYYYTPEEALTRYLGSMRDAIEVGKLFGNSGEFETSIWLFIAQEVADWQIQYEDAEKVRELLDAKFEKTKNNPFINWVKTVGYSASLGSFSSTITQLWDLSFSFIENGVNKTLKEYWRSITGRSELKASEFGLNDIGQEFRWDGVAKKVLSTILKWSGFSWMDKRGKETYINSTFRELISKAKKDDKLLNRDLAEYYGEIKAKQIIKDLREWNATDDVRTYIFLKLCNIQPLTATEMPIWYHKNPVFYMLKSFALKQIDYITKKWVKYAIANPKKWIPRLARIMFFIMLMNWLSDELKNITLWRKYNSLFYRLLNGEDIGPALSWLFWDNFFKMFWLTKYSIYEAKTDGVDKAFSAIFFSVPPLQVPWNIISDIFGMANGKTSFEDLKSIQMIPWVGKPMYRRVGKWQASQQKKMETESKEFAPTRGWL